MSVAECERAQTEMEIRERREACWDTWRSGERRSESGKKTRRWNEGETKMKEEEVEWTD